MSESEKSEEAFENVTEDDLPQHILEKYDTERQVQLIKGYRLLQVLLYYESNKPFFEKPDNDVLGTKRYYDVIENPMWLFEVKRKFFHAEYHSLFEAIKDIRLIFENCYYFWGPRALLTEQCLRMERQFEQQISLLPKDLKNLCTLEKTHGPCDKIANKVWNHCKNRGKICSILMLRTWRRRRQFESETYVMKSNITNFCEYGRQLMKWESSNLPPSEDYNALFSMQELPEIGLFLQLIQSQFEVGPFSQCEIERMLLIPQYSSLFLRILSILLDVTEEKQSLSYENIHRKLEERVSQWYTIFESLGDDPENSESFQNTGIDLDFFEAIGHSNPFVDEQKFDTFSYYKKVIMLRALCDSWVHQRSAVSKLIMTTDVDSFVQKLGQDKHGYTYVYCNRFLDFRMYKVLLQDNQHSKLDQDEANTEGEVVRLPLKHLFAGEAIVKDCELKADSLEQLRCVIDDLYYSDLESGSTKKDAKGPQCSLVQALLKLDADLYSKEEEFIRVTNECRIRLYDEWRETSGCEEPSISEEETEPLENEESTQTNEEDNHDGNEDDRFVPSGECDTEENADQIETSQNKLDGENDSAFETSEERRSRKRKKKKKKKKKKRKSRDYEEESPKLNESFTEEFHDDIVKEEPVDEDELHNHESSNPDADDDSKSEMKGELPNSIESNGVVNSRRRRSSVPSYNVYKHDVFSDEDESAEEMYSSEEDSDDEWEIPCKRSKNKRNKPTRPNRVIPVLPKTEGSGYATRRRDDSHVAHPASNASTNDNKQGSPVKSDLNFVPEVIIKEEDIKTERNDESVRSDGTVVKEEDKPTQKIKVIDFAKLVNTTPTPTPPLQTLKPNLSSSPNLNPNAYVVRSAPGVNSLPVIRAAFSQAQPQNVYMRQPMMRNAYVISSPNQQPSYGIMNANPMSGYVSTRTMAPTATPRIIGAQSINPACPNQKAAFKQAVPYDQPMMMRFSLKQQQMNKNKMVYYNPASGARPYSAPYSNSYTPLQKVGRNVTVEAKPMQRRPGVREIEGTIGIHSNSGGILQYVVNLANGSHVPLSNEQVQKLREGNNGTLPTKLKIPVPVDVAEKIEPCVVIDD